VAEYCLSIIRIAVQMQVSVRFPVSPTCDMSHLIVDVVARLGGPMNDGAGSCGNEMVVRAWDR
jgi:hypothetical protein